MSDILKLTDAIKDLDDVGVLTRTLYGEARGESLLGKVAVAMVVTNRLRRPGWWTRNRGDGIPDDTVRAACLDPYQFSCWLPEDPNRRKLESFAGDAVCETVAALAIEGLLTDPTKGATHYHAHFAAPPWAKGLQPCLTTAGHRFYNDVP